MTVKLQGKDHKTNLILKKMEARETRIDATFGKEYREKNPNIEGFYLWSERGT